MSELYSKSKEAQDVFYKQIGANICNARKRKRLTQEELSELLGISRVSVNNIENGKQRLPLHVINDVCQFLAITIPDIVPNKPLDVPVKWEEKVICCQTCNCTDNSQCSFTVQKFDNYQHLTDLSKDYKRTEILNKEVNAFLNQNDGGYDNVNQAFKSGAYFGMNHALSSANLVGLVEVVSLLENRSNELDAMQLQVQDWELQSQYYYATEQLRKIITQIKQLKPVKE